MTKGEQIETLERRVDELQRIVKELIAIEFKRSGVAPIFRSGALKR